MKKEDIKVMSVVMKSVVLPADAWLMIARACELAGREISRSYGNIGAVIGQDIWESLQLAENTYYEIKSEITKQVNR